MVEPVFKYVLKNLWQALNVITPRQQKITEVTEGEIRA